MTRGFGEKLTKWSILLASTACFFAYQNCGNVNVSPLPDSYPRITYKVVYCPENGNKLRNFFARNRSAVALGNEFETDQDRDGLSDNFEKSRRGQIYGSTLSAQDTNLDGYSDFAMVKTGYDMATQAFLPKCVNPGVDSDGDGLTDCDESLFHTDPNNPDTDGDGIPDGWEIYSGLNPLDPNDAEQDMDFDQLKNVEEVRMGTPITESNSKDYSNITYSLSTSQEPHYSNLCTTLQASNIPILPVANGNLIQLDVLETTISGKETMKSVQLVVPQNVKNGSIFNDSIGTALMSPNPAGGQ